MLIARPSAAGCVFNCIVSKRKRTVQGCNTINFCRRDRSHVAFQSGLNTIDWLNLSRQHTGRDKIVDVLVDVKEKDERERQAALELSAR